MKAKISRFLDESNIPLDQRPAIIRSNAAHSSSLLYELIEHRLWRLMHQTLLHTLRPSARTAKDLFNYKTQSLKHETAKQEAEPDTELASLLETEEENMLLHEPYTYEYNDLLDEFDGFDDIDDIDEEDLQSDPDGQVNGICIEDESLSHSFASNGSDISMLGGEFGSRGETPRFAYQLDDHPRDGTSGDMRFDERLLDQISDADKLDGSCLCPWPEEDLDLDLLDHSQGDHDESLFSDVDDNMELYISSQPTLAEDRSFLLEGF